MTDTSVAHDLRAAADYLREYGWRRWAMGYHGGPRCMLGALESVCVVRSTIWQRASFVTMKIFDGEPRLAVFNDYHCKTADDAIAVLEIAADLAS
jgi:hypothetical protein